MRQKLYAIAYDIKSNARRTRVANVLKSFGERVQYSVFECFLTRAEVDELETEVKRRIDQSEDSVRIYRIDTSVRCLGTAEATTPAEHLVL